MKRLVLITATTALLAANANAEPFNGPYVGVQGGYESFNIDSTFTGAGALAGDSAKATFGGDGLNGGAFAGYGVRIDSLYIGGELEAGLGGASSDNKVTIGASNFEANVDHKYDLGASIRAGFLPTPNTLLYGRAGVADSKFDPNGSVKDFSLTGLRLGLGSETALGNGFSVRGDWVYTDYKSKNLSDANGDTFQFSPTSNTFRVGVAYNF